MGAQKTVARSKTMSTSGPEVAAADVLGRRLARIAPRSYLMWRRRRWRMSWRLSLSRLPSQRSFAARGIIPCPVPPFLVERRAMRPAAATTLPSTSASARIPSAPRTVARSRTMSTSGPEVAAADVLGRRLARIAPRSHLIWRRMLTVPSVLPQPLLLLVALFLLLVTSKDRCKCDGYCHHHCPRCLLL